MGKLHAAKLEKSDRLQRVHKYLKGCDGEKSTRDIVQAANVLAVNSIISELRDNGIAIDCRRNGSRWLYKLA